MVSGASGIGDETLWRTGRVSVYKGADPGRPNWKSRFYRLQTLKSRSLVSAPRREYFYVGRWIHALQSKELSNHDKTNGAVAAPVGSAVENMSMTRDANGHVATTIIQGALAAVLFLLPVSGGAQSLTAGSLAGSVKDPSGAVMPGVTVEAAS